MPATDDFVFIKLDHVNSFLRHSCDDISFKLNFRVILLVYWNAWLLYIILLFIKWTKGWSVMENVCKLWLCQKENQKIHFLLVMKIVFLTMYATKLQNCMPYSTSATMYLLISLPVTCFLVFANQAIHSISLRWSCAVLRWLVDISLSCTRRKKNNGLILRAGLSLTCPQPLCTGALTKAGLYRTIRRVLDFNGWYLMGTESLECRWCCTVSSCTHIQVR